MKFLFILLSFLSLPLSAQEEAEWEVVFHEDGMYLEVQQKDEQGFYSLQGSILIEAPMDEVLAILDDSLNKTQWLNAIESIHVEEKLFFQKKEYYYVNMPLFMTDRFVLLQTKPLRVSEDKVFVSLHNYKSKKYFHKSAIPTLIKDSFMTIESLGKNRTLVKGTFLINPQGDIPSWVVSRFFQYYARESLENFRNEIYERAFTANELLPYKGFLRGESSLPLTYADSIN